MWAAPLIFLTSSVHSTIGLYKQLLNGTKNGDVDGMYNVNEPLASNYVAIANHVPVHSMYIYFHRSQVI